MPQVPHSPTQVYLLHVREILVVKTPKFIKNLCSNEHARSCRPENFLDIIVLTGILFKRVKHPSAAKGISVSVNVSAAGTRVFKFIFIGKRKNFRLAGGNSFIA